MSYDQKEATVSNVPMLVMLSPQTTGLVLEGESYHRDQLSCSGIESFDEESDVVVPAAAAPLFEVETSSIIVAELTASFDSEDMLIL